MAAKSTPTAWKGPNDNPSGAYWPSDLYQGVIGQVIVTPDPTSGYPQSQRAHRAVILDSTMSTVPYDGAIAWWKDRGAGIVTTDPTGRRGHRAGVFTGAAPLTSPATFALSGPSTTVATAVFIQVGGRHANVKFIDGVTAAPTAAGLIVIPSATAGKADCLAAGSAATYPILGYTAGAYNAPNATAAVDLQIEDTY